jgi:hypothetical protein
MFGGLPIQTNPTNIINTAVESSDLIFSAILAGVILYFVNKSFLNNVPAYVTIIAGFLLVTYLGSYQIVKDLGFVLLTDGIYKLIKQYISVSS